MSRMTAVPVFETHLHLNLRVLRYIQLLSTIFTLHIQPISSDGQYKYDDPHCSLHLYLL
jgi:hypothetical protein